MKQNVWIVILLVMSQALGTGSGLALDGGGETPFRLNEVVVTASRIEEALKTVPARVEVISRETIERYPGTKIDEVLRSVAGIHGNRRSDSDMRPVVGMRGLGAFEQGRVLVLIDGVPANKTDNGDFNWNRVNPQDVERIEVFKGAGSSVYGSNAMGGVVHIITRRPEQPLSGHVTGRAGSHDTYGGDFSLSMREQNDENGWYGRISGLYRDTDGHEAASDYDRATAVGQGYDIMPLWLEEWSTSALLGYDIDAHNRLELDYQHYDDQRSEGQRGDDHAEGEHRNFTTDFVRIGYQGAAGPRSWQASGFYQAESYYKLYDRPAPRANTDVDSDRVDFGAGAHYAMPLGPAWNTVGMGVDLRQGQVNAQDMDDDGVGFIRNEGIMRFYALYLQDEMRLLDQRLRISLGLRYDYVQVRDCSTEADPGHLFAGYLNANPISDESWDAASPRVSARYFFTDAFSAYLSYARGFRAPELDDLCRTGFQYVGPKIANPSLRPETVDTFEGGADWQIRSNLNASVSAFYSLGNDFLYYVDTGIPVAAFGFWSTRTYQQKQNVGEVEIYGLELGLTCQPARDLSVYLNYAYSQNEIVDYQTPPFAGAADLTGKALRYTPPHVLNLGVEWLRPWVNTRVDLTWNDAQYTDDVNTDNLAAEPYTLVDVKLWRQFGDHVTASLTIENLFDEEHTITPGGTGTVGGVDYSRSSYNSGRVCIGALTWHF